MSNNENTSEVRPLSSKELKLNTELLEKEKRNTPEKGHKSPSPSPKGNSEHFSFIPERELQTNFSLSFKEIYNIHITEIEEKTKLKRKYIYYFLLVSLFFFLIGHFEIIFSYVITAYFPIRWTIEDYKVNKENFGKKWGTYWSFFSFFIFFDFHKKEVLKIIPLYFIVKTLFLVILYLPGFTAAINLYDGFIKDILQTLSVYFQNKDENDTMLNDLKRCVKQKTE